MFLGEKKHTANLKFSKFIADISIAQEKRNFNNFTLFLNPEFDSLMTQLADENIINRIPASQKMK